MIRLNDYLVDFDENKLVTRVFRLDTEGDVPRCIECSILQHMRRGDVMRDENKPITLNGLRVAFTNGDIDFIEKED